MRTQFPKGVYPVMLTPFTEDNKIDYNALEKLINWYIDAGVAGLFAVCQSSEMFFLSLEERIAITKFVVEKTNNRVPVISSGHISESIDKQILELKEIAKTGVDAVILLTNRLAKEEEDDEIWLNNLKEVISRLPKDVPLGFYECPYPYKRIISPELLKWCADTDRFYFIKDTSCDIKNIKAKLQVIQGTRLQLFNANSSTLLESLKEGASGFSGVMANFHPELYVWLVENFQAKQEDARHLADLLTVLSFIERQVYPVNAKYHQLKIGNFNTIKTRSKNIKLFNQTSVSEVEQFHRLTENFKKNIFGNFK